MVLVGGKWKGEKGWLGGGGGGGGGKIDVGLFSSKID